MFKKLLLVLGLGLTIGSISASAQQFKFDKDTLIMCSDVGTAPHSDTFAVGDNWDNVEMHNYITNLTNDTFVYKWNVIVSQTSTPAGWDWFGFCDNYLCRAPRGTWLTAGETQTSSPLAPGTLAPQQNRDLKALICAPSNKPDGTAILRIRVYVENGQADTVTFIFKKPCNPTGITDLLSANDSRVTLSPNPASNTLRVYADKELNAGKIYVFNILGGRQMEVPVNRETSAVDISALSPGMYVVRIEGKNGQLITTRKFVKN
ncbi:T9SS type A sorting domain-containing protein [Taibaiella chishuiensis]|uniref:Putative secreted protein (Por secretion system target) n=1 Tax=Taibaiella chishuiensis TaxID=1434707 RepID=A0A2P8CST4_9BACT|nr:T9SS type A sorting domain-containing protein [Taibaiella chishuiensis]PSK88019.1 putative secreted protein (Por secretion system target) [Taibaiella chishuiensis]